MAEVTSPTVLESFAENRIKALLEAQLTKVPDANILTGHTLESAGDDEAAVVTVTVTRQEEDIPGSGWWVCDIETELDPREFLDDEIDALWLEVETALGDGDPIEAQITNGRLYCMTGSAFYDQPHDYQPSAGERLRYFRFSASLGLTSS